MPISGLTHPFVPLTREGKNLPPMVASQPATVQDWARAEGGYYGPTTFAGDLPDTTAGPASVSGRLTGNGGPAEEGLMEGGPYAGFVLPSAEAVREWALAEGGYFGGYVPGPLAGYAGPDIWGQFEGGAFGDQTSPPW